MSTYNIDVLNHFNTKIYLLEFNEDFNADQYLYLLNTEEKDKYKLFLSLKRKKEFIAVRILKERFFKEFDIIYNSLGAPSFQNSDLFMSISHANNIVGLAVNQEFKVGFDIELIHNKVEKLYNKFVSDNECKEFDCNSVEELISMWSMKETLYKLAACNFLDFKSNFFLKKIKSNLVNAKIIFKNQSKEVTLHYFKYKTYIISFNITALK